MLKIKRTIFDHIKEQDFSRYMFINPEQIQKYSGNILYRSINHLLPPTNKIFRETFNALDGKKILAQISLVPDKFSNLRCQISSLKIRHGAEFSAKPLIDYIINNYGGSGIQSFMVYIDENEPNIIALFKLECGFRSCAKIEFYETNELNAGDFEEENFKDLEVQDIEKLLEINTANIFPHYRPALTSKAKDFRYKFLKHTKNDFFKVFCVNSVPEGYFRLYDNGNGNFVADIITSKPYEQCYWEIISYIENYLKKSQKFNTLTILLKKYRETSPALEEALKTKLYIQIGATQILVKDYWQTSKESQNEEKLFVLFNDLTSQAARNISFML
ncbi:MAG: hypothetical protein K6A44_05140 [bacterium]|nr:hypothetical protein [bacterium]